MIVSDLSSALVPPTVVIEKTFDAPLEDLWALWTTKNGFEAWWAPDDYLVEVHLLEPQLGGKLEYDMLPQRPVGQRAPCSPANVRSKARFMEFRPRTRLVLVHLMDIGAKTPPYDHKIEVDFRVEGNLVTMIVTLHPHPHVARTVTAAQVLRSQLHRFANLVEAR